jgi:hypothetical protein
MAPPPADTLAFRRTEVEVALLAVGGEATTVSPLTLGDAAQDAFLPDGVPKPAAG